MTSLYLNNLRDHLDLFATLGSLNAAVTAAAEIATASLRDGRKLMSCGNGASAADSQHLAAELTGRFVKHRKPLAAMALSSDTSALTCIGNDYSFAEVFDRQIRGLGQAGDCLIGISTSGNSENIIRAVSSAHKMGISTIGLLGHDGGKLRLMCDMSVVVKSATTARIQEAHILIGHALCGLIEQALGLVETE